jgi:hypothetical protein
MCSLEPAMQHLAPHIEHITVCSTTSACVRAAVPEINWKGTFANNIEY